MEIRDRKRLEIAEILLEYGAVIDAKDHRGRTAVYRYRSVEQDDLDSIYWGINNGRC